MTRINDKNAQLNRWLARIFPPSSPQYSQPSELNDTINLVSHVLPPSLLYERLGFQTGDTVNPATELFFPSTAGIESVGSAQAGVPNGKFYWIVAARWSPLTQVGTTVGRAFIALKNILNVNELGMSHGIFGVSASTFSTDFIDLHCPQASPVLGSGATPIQMGGGGGPFVVPPGYCVHFSTTQSPAAATIYRAVVQYAICDIGELHP